MKDLALCAKGERFPCLMNYAALKYSDAVSALARGIGTLAQSDYNKLQQEVEQARRHSEDPRQALERHSSEHGS